MADSVTQDRLYIVRSFRPIIESHHRPTIITPAGDHIVHMVQNVAEARSSVVAYQLT